MGIHPLHAAFGRGTSYNGDDDRPGGQRFGRIDKRSGPGSTSITTDLVVEITGTLLRTPSVPDLAAASDSGVSDTDNITSETPPTFTGTAAIGSTVTIKDRGSVLGTTTADATGDWSFTPERR